MATTDAADTATAPYRSEIPPGSDGFAALVRAEWTKFRTVPGWVAGTVAAAVVIVALGLLTVAGTEVSVPPGLESTLAPVVGPEGTAVTDRFTFVHHGLTGDGTVTARVTALDGDRLPPWAKAGVIIKDGTRPGSTYAAVMATGAHGTRLQYDYVHDTAGRSAGVSPGAPRWLRLTRTGPTVTASESDDGATWTGVGRVDLTGLPATAEAGLFVTSPAREDVVEHGFGGTAVHGYPTRARATFDQVRVEPAGGGDRWVTEVIGEGPEPTVRATDDGYVLTGSGDIAPVPPGAGGPTVEVIIAGSTAAGLIVFAVLAATFVTIEYRRGLRLVTFAAQPRRVRVLAAKAVVIGTVTFLTALAALALTFAWGGWLLRQKGVVFQPVPALTEARIVVGTAALLAVGAVFTVAVGTILRNGAGTVTLVIGVMVIPHLVALASDVVPTVVSDWVLRLTPAVGFAVQQSVPEYPQVDSACVHTQGCYPLAPGVGFGVLCAYAVLALVLAGVLLERRDA